MARLLLIGIDGLDWKVTRSLLDDMPVISKLLESGYGGPMKSIFPPDSIPSWISIFTGLDPSEHGILETIDYFKKDAKSFSIDTEAFQGKTFWDRASLSGKSVLVVNPLMAFPSWKVNGIMASGPVFISGKSGTCPPHIADEFPLPPLGGIVDFPDKHELTEFYDKTCDETMEIVKFTSELMNNNEWDLTFVTLLTMDRICHFFWRYYDRDDPTWPGKNEHSDVIPAFHRFMDKCVGMLIDAAGKDTTIMIVSDHGHAMRPPLLFNLNQLLMDNGLLKSRISGPRLMSPRYHLEKMKNITLETLHRFDLEDIAYRFAHIFPWTRKLKKKDFMTSPDMNIATASGFGGTNPFGGIDISASRCKEEGLDYEETRDRVIRLLIDLKDENDTKYFIWVRRREEMFKGPFIDRYPDILYEMRPEFGTNWSVHLPLVTTNPRHRKISGGHRNDAILIAGPLNGLEIIEEEAKSINISASVSSILSFEGHVKNSGLSSSGPGSSFIRKVEE
ncbi:MAG: alkaline phosphatase family protein [Bacteroidales bacterium]|nr:alkaline phosphatase family protein [Candidatus Latescibacterota bacterium]